MKRTSFLMLSVTTVSALALVGCSPGATADNDSDSPDVAKIANYDGADRQEFLEECAAEEGALVVYSSQNYLWEALRDGFRAKYPDIAIESSRRPSAEVAAALTKEQAAGVYNADVVALKIESANTLLGLFEPYTTPEHDAFPADALGPDRKYTVGDRMPFAIAYNSDLVKGNDIPKTSEDLLNPLFDGRIAMITSSPGIQWTGLMEKLYGEDFIEEFGDMNIQTTDTASDQLATQIAAGEYLIAPAINLSGVHAIRESVPDAPLAWAPVDTLWSAGTVSLLSKAPHPCAGMLYIDFALSQEGQAVVPNANMSAREDMEVSADLPQGVEALDITQVVGSSDGDEYLANYARWTELMDRHIIAR